ncbi:MAG: hypothetical protein EOR68_22260 [Mesorhizobium sp.]|nr:MAG: hypothetical protein EOR68_22260 [Mesorhizobium sp.]TIP50151.1 MAG: DinB family protein [Mesorhizobium sp.]TJV70226.1 MAG: DinB family protein [Mesorhizobium sp.]
MPTTAMPSPSRRPAATPSVSSALAERDQARKQAQDLLRKLDAANADAPC